MASDTDRFRILFGNTDGNRDTTENNGYFIGRAFDVRLRYKLTPCINTMLGDSNFSNGEFVCNRQASALGRIANSTDFFYFQVMITAFK